MTHVSHDYEVGIGLALHIFVKISKYEYSMRSSTYRDGSVSFIFCLYLRTLRISYWYTYVVWPVHKYIIHSRRAEDKDLRYFVFGIRKFFKKTNMDGW
jgi:hypothetical protein